MNRIFSTILSLIIILLLVQCNSEESRKEKAEELIKKDLFETLPDYKSYELVSIEMDTIKETWISIPGIIDLAKEYQQAFAYEDNAKIRYNELLEQKERLKKRAFNRYMASDLFGLAEIGNQMKRLDDEIATVNSQWEEASDRSGDLYNQLTEKIIKNKTDDFVGWDVTHKFRAKDTDGVMQLYCYHYYISPDFKRVILKWEEGEEEIPQLLNLMESILDTIDKSNDSPSVSTSNDDDNEMEGVAAIAVLNNGKTLHFKSDKTIAEIPESSWEKVKNALVYYTGEGTSYMSILST